MGVILFIFVFMIVVFIFFKSTLNIKSKNKLDLKETGSVMIAKQRLKIEKELTVKKHLVYVSKKRYHKKDCRYVEDGMTVLTIGNAKELKLTACKICKPSFL